MPAEAAADKPKLASGEPKPLLPELPPRGRMVVSEIVFILLQELPQPPALNFALHNVILMK